MMGDKPLARSDLKTDSSFIGLFIICRYGKNHVPLFTAKSITNNQ